MPAAAYALVTLFAVISALAGLLAGRTVGPPRPWTPILPALAAFGALYLVGHRLVLRVGPTIEIFGWPVSLAFDVAVAIGSAFVAAFLQLGAARLLQAQQRGAGRDRLA